MGIETHKDFGPKILQQLDITELLTVLLDHTRTISDTLSENEKYNIKRDAEFESLKTSVTEIKTLLTDHIIHPTEGIISKVKNHDDFIETIKKENIVEIAKRNDRALANINKLTWIVVATVVSMAVKVFIFS